MKQTKMIDVCCALILKASKILAVQRGPETNHAWQWEFPGGKIQERESAEQCIKREIQEELCIRIEIVTKLESVKYDYGFNQVQLIPFVCRIISGEIELTEHVAMQWLEYNELEIPVWSAADRELIHKNKISLKQLMLRLI